MYYQRKSVHLLNVVLMGLLVWLPISAPGFSDAMAPWAEQPTRPQGPNGQLAILVQNSEALDADEQNILDFAQGSGLSYQVVDAQMIQAGSVDLLDFPVLYMRTGSTPAAYEAPDVVAALQGSVEAGAHLILEFYGLYLAQYLGVGTVSMAGWLPAVNDASYYVEAITPSELLGTLVPWSPPELPDREEQLISRLKEPGYYTYPSLAFHQQPAAIDYWFLLTTGGWPGQSTDSDYCVQHPGLCRPERSVYQANGDWPDVFAIRYVRLGEGLVYSFGLGSPSKVPADELTIGPVTDQLRQNAVLEAERVAFPLALGAAVEDRIAPLIRHDYSIEIGAEQSLVVEVVPLAGSNQLWVESRAGDLPDFLFHDQRTSEPTVRDVYELLISPTIPGTYYFSVFGRDVSPAGGAYQITVRAMDRYLSDVRPSSGGNMGQTTLNLSGLGLVEGMAVELRAGGLPPLVAKEVRPVSPTALWARFDLEGAAEGVYDVCAAWPDAAEERLAGAFTVVPGSGAHLEAHLVVPEAVRPGRQYTLWLSYANTGDADLPAPLFVLSASQGVQMRLAPDEPYVSGPIQLLGIGPDQPAGSLHPGAQHEIPIFFQADGTAEIRFALEQVIAGATAIDWDGAEANYRWGEIDLGTWDPFWQALVAHFGATRAAYLATLASTASALALNEPPVYDVPTLIGAVALEVAQATGNTRAATEAALPLSSSSEPYQGVTFSTYDRDGNLVDITGLSAGQIEALAPSGWSGDLRLIIHGWNSERDGWPTEMGLRMRGASPNDLVVMVDIPGYRTGPWPYAAAGFIPEAGDGIAQFWRDHGFFAASTHCTGHSLGAHTCTEASVKLREMEGNGFNRCSALDPATIGGRRSLAECSSTCVDQYKSSILGIRGNEGHVVWTVRDGGHNNARVLFYNSIGNPNCAGGFHVACSDPVPYRWKGNLNLDCTGSCAVPDSQDAESEAPRCADGSCEDLAPNQEPPGFSGAGLDEATVALVRPIDPNEKTGPAGTGTDKVVEPGDELRYTIYFENVPSATAPAQEVVIADALDLDLDWSSLQFTEIAFGEHVIPVSEGMGGFYVRKFIADYRAEENASWWVDVTGEMDYQAGQVRWVFRTLDPATGEPPEDPLAGFLPPNDVTGRGEGHVVFSVRPKDGLPLGTLVSNSASIVFDTNAAIETNEVWNTVGPQLRIFLPVVLRNS